MENKIRVLLCSASLERKGGVTNYVRLILDNYPSDKYVIKHFVQGYNSEYMNFFYPIIFLIQLSKFEKELKKFNPDIVHINPSLVWAAIIRDYIFMKCAKKKGFSVLFSVGGWKKNISKYFRKKNILSNFFYNIFKMPDMILVLASSFKKELLTLGIDPNKIIVTTMMVESEKFKQKNKIFVPPFTLLFCSRIEKLKGIYQLLDAFQLVIRKYPNTKLIYVGQGSEFKNLNKKIYQMKLERNAKCVGFKSGAEKINYFKNSDMLLLPSFTEGFPNIFCEAMAAGLPYIGTHVGGLVDTFEDRKHGLVIKSIPPKPEEIADKILELIDDQKLMKEISENNLRDAAEKYDVNIVIAKLDSIYKEMLNTKGK